MKRAVLAAALAAAVLMTGCAAIQSSVLYSEAVADIESGDCLAALSALETIPAYRDAPALIARCRAELERQRQSDAYGAALSLQAAGDYEAAYRTFAAIPGYCDADARAEDCRSVYCALLRTEAEETLLRLASKTDWETGLPNVAALLARCEGDLAADRLNAVVAPLAAGDYAAAGRAAAGSAADGSSLTRGEWVARFRALASAFSDEPERALRALIALKAAQPDWRVDWSRNAADGGLRIGGEDTLQLLGTEPDGKALVFVTRHGYIGADEAYIDCDLQRAVPDAIYPDTLAAVEYVVTVRFDYLRVKRFDGYYTDGVREYAELTATHLPSGEIVGGPVVIVGPLAENLDTADMASDYVSGGPPNAAAVEDALNALLLALPGA